MMRRTFRLWANFTPLYMPALSPSMEKGKIINWNKKVGEEINPGDILCKVETDKAAMDFKNTSDEGILAKIFVGDGEDAVVTQVIAVLVDDAADVANVGEYELPEVEGGAAKEETAAAPAPTPTPAAAAAPAPNASRPAGDLSRSGPAVARVAKGLAPEKLNAVTPSGKDGRYVKSDFAGVTSIEYVNGNDGTVASAPVAQSTSPGATSSSSSTTSSVTATVIPGQVYNFKVRDNAILSKLTSVGGTFKKKTATA